MNTKETIKRDCILYKSDKVCTGLKKIYCTEENCNFYKSQKEYDKYGSKISDISDTEKT